MNKEKKDYAMEESEEMFEKIEITGRKITH